MRISDLSSDVCSSALSSSTLSLTSSSILPQFPSTLHPHYHSLLHQFSLNPPIFFIHFITNFFINSPSLPFDSDRKSTRLNSSHYCESRMQSSARKKKTI